MNQQTYQPMGGQRPSTVRPWLLIILIVVILAGAGFFWYYYFGPGKSSGTTTPTTTTKTDETADWSTFKSETFGYTIKYPKDWEYLTEGPNTTFAPKTAKEISQLGISVRTEKFPAVLASEEETLKKESTINEQTDATFAGEQAQKITAVNSTDKTIKPTVYFVSKNDYVYVATDEGNAKYKDIVSKMIKSFKFTTPAATTTPTATSTDLTYTDPTYDFTMTFPAAWKGYKFKEADLSGATMTYYVEIPTTDTNAAGDSTADAGYYSPFAISVYTLPQWAVIEASDGPKDTLITKNDTHAFAWSQANGVPPSDFTLSSDIQKIIDSFELKS